MLDLVLDSINSASLDECEQELIDLNLLEYCRSALHAAAANPFRRGTVNGDQPLARIIHVGWVEYGNPYAMVRCANRLKTGCRVHEGLTPCVTHHFRRGSLHAPYGW